MHRQDVIRTQQTTGHILCFLVVGIVHFETMPMSELYFRTCM